MKPHAACLVIWLAAGLFLSAGHAQQYFPREGDWVPSGDVYTTLRIGNLLYIGGYFDAIGPRTGGAAVLDGTTGELVLPQDQVLGDGYRVWSDNHGGWFISTFRDFYHLLPDGRTNPAWQTKPRIFCLAVSGETVYMGGQYGVLAAYDFATAARLPWDPQLPEESLYSTGPEVEQMAIYGNRIYISGRIARDGRGYPKTKN
jgi:hypothetical protein